MNDDPERSQASDTSMPLRLARRIDALRRLAEVGPTCAPRWLTSRPSVRGRDRDLHYTDDEIRAFLRETLAAPAREHIAAGRRGEPARRGELSPHEQLAEGAERRRILGF